MNAFLPSLFLGLFLYLQPLLAEPFTFNQQDIELELPAKRVVSFDYRYTEMLLSLGIEPVGIADSPGYLRNVGLYPAKVKKIAQVGTKNEPSFETLALLQPDLILATQFRHSGLLAQFKRIAPTLLMPYTEHLSIQEDSGNQLATMLQEYRLLAKVTAKEQTAEERINALDTALDLLSASHAPQSVAYIQFLPGAQRFRWFSVQSLPGTLLKRAGWQVSSPPSDGPFDFDVLSFAFLQQLNADQVLVTFLGDQRGFEQLKQKPVWQDLQSAYGQNLTEIPVGIWAFGGPESALSFVETLTTITRATSHAVAS